jgi:hypothetical protein
VNSFYIVTFILSFKPNHLKTRILLALSFLLPVMANAQEKSVARSFMEAGLEMIRLDGQGPTIHSRNLFHLSAAMYDSWAVFDGKAKPFLLGQNKREYHSDFDLKFRVPDSMKSDSALNMAISYAAFRLLRYRFNLFGSKGRTLDVLDSTFNALGYDPDERSLDYRSGSAIAIGNYVAKSYIDFGLMDGANERDEYEATSYNPINPPLNLIESGNESLVNKNRWQPVDGADYVAKKGSDVTLKDWQHLIVNNQTDFLTPHWGDVLPFAMDDDDMHILQRGNSSFKVYVDPGAPPYLDFSKDSLASENYKWGFVLVALWSSLLDPSDSLMINISPGAKGNEKKWPKAYKDYYRFLEGGTIGEGHDKNPITGEAYAANWVRQGDYYRVIAEYWVDGVNTSGPPGHWFQVLNQVSDHPSFEKRWMGKGKVLSDLEWDIKTYFTLGGTVMDAGIAAWSVKAAYDYIRPISAIRYMAQQGQCSDPKLPNYHREGLPLIEGKIALIKKGDPLAGENKEHVGKVKIRAWKGPEYIKDPLEDVAGVDWVRAEDWWPYQQYSFVTPPFAGYVSGHSCFSIASSELLGLITGDPFFPGGMAEHTLKKDEFLLFENGPSEDITLQWATYRDAAIETCLSRISGGIHPPCDDMEGRRMGEKVAQKAFKKANEHFGY